MSVWAVCPTCEKRAELVKQEDGTYKQAHPIQHEGHEDD